MAKDIKDYLHLYLGCEAGFPTGKGVLKGVTEWAAYVEDSSKTLYTISINNVVPHLRKLSDITEEECNELDWFYKIGDEKVDHGEVSSFTPTDFMYLTSKGFDLFNLIDEKLAIDKDTLTQLSTTNGNK